MIEQNIKNKEVKTGYNTYVEVDEVDSTKNNKLATNEQEITFIYNRGEKKTYASCSIPTKWKEFEERGWTITKVINYRNGEPSVKFYEADGMMFGIKNINRKKREMTEEQKQASAKRLKIARENKNKTV